VLRHRDVEPIPEAVAYQFKVSSQAMKSNPVTTALMEDSAIHSWYGPGRQLISGSSSRGEGYAVTLTIYTKENDAVSDSLDVLVANSSSSYRKGDVYAMRKSVEMFEPRVRQITEMAQPEDCFLWKLAHIPKLDSWVSHSGKVTILGDAAHAMVPHLGMVKCSCS
jgi:salicylate hydroxylase